MRRPLALGILLLAAVGLPASAAERRVLPGLLPGGASSAMGDFNRDGFDDLVVGVPGEAIGSATQAGAVHVIYGGVSGLTAKGSDVLHQNSPEVRGISERGDLFGAAAAAGDLNRDGYDDLAVGAPGEDTPSGFEAGAVNVFYGGRGGIRTYGSDLYYVRDVEESRDNRSSAATGWRLVIGDFVGQGNYYENDFQPDGYEDLAIGIPRLRRILGGHSVTSAVVIYPGSPEGFEPDIVGNVAGGPQHTLVIGVNAHRFGHAMDIGDFDGDGKSNLMMAGSGFTAYIVGRDDIRYGPPPRLTDGAITDIAAGDFDGDGFGDLAVGSADEDVGTAADAGLVVVDYGGEHGFTEARQQTWHEGSPFILGTPESGDNFGRVLEAADLNGDGYSDLAVGSPRECLKACPSAQGAMATPTDVV